jgi:glutamate carboxypeptidase
MAKMLMEAFAPLYETCEKVELEPRKWINEAGVAVEKSVAEALRFTKHANAAKKVLLVGHMDTVFPESSSFKAASLIESNRLQGPGVADMKGGLIVMLEALKELESGEHAGKLGWEVIITTDEEVGSPSSKKLLMEAAKRADIGLIFEPSLPDGTLVSARKGSATVEVIARGRSAHAGREHEKGRNAVTALAHFIAEAHKLHAPEKGTIINFGHIQGGVAANVVPDLAIAKVNIRADQEIERTVAAFQKIAEKAEEGITIEVVPLTLRPPKPFDEKTEALFNAMRACGEELGIELDWQPSGGVCDGNFLAAAGLPCIDTIGVIGGKIHTEEEYVELDSIETRAKLVGHFLNQFASGEVSL